MLVFSHSDSSMHRTGSRLPTVEQSTSLVVLSHTLRAEMEPRNTCKHVASSGGGGGSTGRRVKGKGKGCVLHGYLHARLFCFGAPVALVSHTEEEAKQKEQD